MLGQSLKGECKVKSLTRKGEITNVLVKKEGCIDLGKFKGEMVAIEEDHIVDCLP